LYGGSVSKWVDDNKIANWKSTKHPIANLRTFVTRFEEEIKRVITIIERANPEVVAIATELNKRNVEASAASIFAQTLERIMLTLVYDYLLNIGLLKGKKVRETGRMSRRAVLMYDGIMIMKKAVEESIASGKIRSYDDLLLRIERQIYDITGCNLKLKDKPIVYGYTKEYLMDHQREDATEAEEDEVEMLDTHPKLCKKIAELNPGWFKSHTDGRLAVYSPSKGMWVQQDHDATKHVAAIVILNREAYPKCQTKTGIQYWGDNSTALHAALKDFDVHVRDDAWFEESTQANGVGKILFQDGIYDFKTRTFTEGFNPEIVFHHQAPIRFNLSAYEGMEEEYPEGVASFSQLVEYIRYSLFVAPATEGNHSLESALWFISKSLSGAALEALKMFLVIDGKTSGGRSTLIDALQSAFGSYVCPIDPNQMCKGKHAVEDVAKQNGMIFGRCMTARLVLTSETPATPMSSQLVKGIAGGDTMVVRENFKNTTSKRPHFMFGHFGNSVDSIFDSVEEALIDRMLPGRYDVAFLRREDIRNPETEKVRDTTIRTRLCSNQVWKRALAQVVMDGYVDELPSLAKASSDAIKTDLIKSLSPGMEALDELGIRITRNPHDIVGVKEVEDRYNTFIMMNPRSSVSRVFRNWSKLRDCLKKGHGLNTKICKKAGPHRDKTVFEGMVIDEHPPADAASEEAAAAAAGGTEVQWDVADFPRTEGFQ